MFTGIVTHTGLATLDAHRLRVAAPRDCMDALEIGGSVAVDGVCLTVATSDDALHFDVSNETLARTTMQEWGDGRRVNLERAMRFGGEIGGHFVSGHVDAVCAVAEVAPEDSGCRIRFEMPKNCAPYICQKGSVCVNGVSLTVCSVDDASFEISAIPYTLQHTNLSDLQTGASVNLEVDLLSRYLHRLLQARESV